MRRTRYESSMERMEFMKYANQTSPSFSRVYGATENYISRSVRDVLPSKPAVNNYRSSHLTHNGTSFHSTYNPDAYTSNHSQSYGRSTDSLVRPSMRARKSSFSEMSSSYSSSRSTSLSPTTGQYEVKTTAKSQTPVRRRSISSSEIASQTKSTTRSPTLSGSALKKSAITIDKKPYDTDYTPSFVSTTYPKRPIEHDLESSHNGYSQTDIGKGTTGLRNIGNTCFMNSILQCLSNTVPLRDYCLNSKYLNDLNKEKSPMKGKLMSVFAQVMKDLWQNKTSPINLTEFKSQIQKFSPRFMGYEQQDCQEFLRFLLEGLHEDINQIKLRSKDPIPNMMKLSARDKARRTWDWYATKDKSFVYDLFVGQLESSLKCLECHHVSLTYDPFWDLSLPLSKSSYSSESTLLSDCLKTFTKEETLDRDEKPTCEECKARRKMIKKLLIHKFPRILVIHLKRFNEGSRYRQKLTNSVKFPLKELNLENYASDQCENRSSAVYDLYAVSNHCGSCYGGHYTAHCINPEMKQWHEFNDSRVTSVSSSSICTKEAYVLFYTQRRMTSSNL